MCCSAASLLTAPLDVKLLEDTSCVFLLHVAWASFRRPWGTPRFPVWSTELT